MPDKLGLRFLNLILSHQHSDLMLDDERCREFYFSSKPVRAHEALHTLYRALEKIGPDESFRAQRRNTTSARTSRPNTRISALGIAFSPTFFKPRLSTGIDPA